MDSNEPGTKAKDNPCSGSKAQRTRLAPSPTGALHLGNASSFLICWALARKQGWEIILRVEDLDGPRIKPEATEQAIDILGWLGLDWDGPAITQSHEPEPHREAMGQLARAGLVYPTTLSRSELMAAASAPHAGEGEIHCPPSVRPAMMPGVFDDPAKDWRFATPEGAVRFVDRLKGEVAANPAQTVGDFVVWTRRQQPSYQLAVVVDDARQGITQVVRGDDLLDSAGRQLLLWRALGLGSEPCYWHLPLVIGPDGRRLAKRHGDTRVATYREAGVTAERVVGLIARWHGLDPGASGRMSAQDFVSTMRIERLAEKPIIFTEEDHQWLLKDTG